MTPIPLVDLKVQHAQIAEEVERGMRAVMEGAAFILGKQVEEFEQAYARFLGVKHCIGVGNGGDALELSLRALGVGQGDEVILPANSFVATAMAVVRVGARPVLVDSDPEYHLIDVSQVARRIGPRTKAIMPVHLYGQVAPMDDLRGVAMGIPIVEDAAQAQGARWNGVCAGALGSIAGTSFYPGKNLGAYGDAGAVTTSDDTLAHAVRALRNYGGEAKYQHDIVGFNSRLDTLQAVVLSAKLRRLDDWNAQRRSAARRYTDMLAQDRAITLPAVRPRNEHIHHLYVIRVPRRDEVLKKLHAAGIGAGIHYPCPIHLQGAFAWLGHMRGDFPVAERAAEEVLSLPIYPGITEEQQSRVVAELRKAVS